MGYYLKNRQLQTGGPGVVAGNVLTGNVAISNSGNIVAIGNITAAYFIGNGSYLTGVIADVSNIHNGNSNITIAATGGNAVVAVGGTANVAVFANTGEYVNGVVVASVNVRGGNFNTTGQISATGNITANSASFFIGNGSQLTGVVASASGFPVVAGTSNIAATPSGNIGISVAAVSNVLVIANTGIYTTGATTITGNVTAGNINTVGQATVGNLSLSGNTIGTNNSTVAAFTGDLGVGIPYGNTAQRPITPPTGTSRLNTDLDQMEMWDGTQWLVIGPTVINNTVTDQQFTGDGATSSFTLSEPASASSLLVSLNGVGQLPGTAYTVSNTDLIFTQAPALSDVIDVRFLAAALGHDLIYDAYGNAIVRVYDTPEIALSINSANALVVNSALVVDVSGSTSLQLPVYTVAQAVTITAPATGQTIYVSNGDAGNPCLAVYSAGAWKRIAFGANISTT